MKLNENPLNKTILPQGNNFPLQPIYINLSDIPDFIFPEKDQKISELFNYLVQIIQWPYYTLNDIYEKFKSNNNKNINFIEWEKELDNIEKEKKNRIINSINKSSKLIIESVIDYMKFLNFYFYKLGEKIRSFIFLEYFLKKLEKDKYIINTDEFCHLYKLYFYLCRDTENIFEYLEKNRILIKNELFYYEKACHYERIHKYKEANQTYIEGFINILGDNNNDNQLGQILKNQYINFENRMANRITRDLETLDEDWGSIDAYIHKKILESQEKELNSKNLNDNKKYFLISNKDECIEDRLLKNITYNFSLAEGKLTLKDNNRINNGIEVVGLYGNAIFIKNPPDINKVTNVTFIYEIMKICLSLFYTDWKREYDNFDLEVKQNIEKLPYSWINKLRPTKRNIKNFQENNKALNLVQKEYLNSGGENEDNGKNEKEIISEKDNNNKIDECMNIKEYNKINDHEISCMLNNIGLILDNNDQNNEINYNSNINMNSNNNILQYNLKERDNNTILETMRYQMEHPYQNKNINKEEIKNNNDIKKENNKPKKNPKIKKNKFKCVGTLNFDQDGLMIINLSNENDQKIEIMQSASKHFNKNEKENMKNEKKKKDKKYTFTLDNIPRRIKYIKEKTLNEKKLYEKRKQEMLQGINFEYLNLFKKLFETYPQLNNLLENEQINNKNKITEEYNLNLLQKNDNNNIDVVENTNIQRQNGPSEAMRLLLEVYGIPKNFLEENNPFIEYAKKNGLNDNFMFENLFKDINSYINSKNSKRKKNLFSNSKDKNNNNENNIKEIKENVESDGDLIIESESESNEEDNNKNKEINNSNNKDNNSKNKGSKHCVFDSKKNTQIEYYQYENNNDEDKNGFGEIIDNINKNAEKGIKIGEKTIFSNHKGVKEHSFNKEENSKIDNNKNNINEEKIKVEKNNVNINKISSNINKSIELSSNKKKEKEGIEHDEINKNKILITNSKISTDIFTSALNYCNNDNNINNINNKILNNNNKNRNNSKRKKKSKKMNDTASIKQNQIINSLSYSLSSDNFNNDNYLSEAISSKSKKSKENKKINIFINEEQILKEKKEKKLSDIKENESKEKEKRSKIERNNNNNDKIDINKDIDIDIQDNIKKNKYDGNIGNIHDLDNFYNLFK